MPVVAVVDGALYLSILLLLLAQETILDLSVLLLLLAQETILDLRVLVCLMAQDIVLDLGVLVQLTLHKGANEAQLQHRQRIRHTRQTTTSAKRQQAATVAKSGTAQHVTHRHDTHTVSCMNVSSRQAMSDKL